MQWSEQTLDLERSLADERPRLLRLCARLSGSPAAAEDLVQETLLAAWRNRAQLESPEKLKPWTSAIARNVCRDWMRRHYREGARLAGSLDAGPEGSAGELPAETSLELELDRSELARLLDQALALLPAPTARLLVEHYLQESSHAEIAERLGVQPGAVAVRLQRGKLTLQRLLRTKLQAESAAFGLMAPGPQWAETNIWCPACGTARLAGRFQPAESFALRCPACQPDPESRMAGLDLTQPQHAKLLGSTKTFKPAYARLLAGLAPLYRQALRAHTAPCLACGRAVTVRVERSPARGAGQITLHCPACGWASNKSWLGLVLSLPEAQRFWRAHPRMRALPVQVVEAGGGPAFVTRLQSVTGAAELTVISRSATFDPVDVHSNVALTAAYPNNIKSDGAG